MKKNMLEILACPIDKNYPLILIEINVEEIEKNKQKKNSSILNSDGEDSNIITQNKDAAGNIADEINHNEKVIVIIDGILYCKKCSRFYPIIDEIPIMLPDELREKEKDLQFLKKWKDSIPEYILTNSNPWHL